MAVPEVTQEEGRDPLSGTDKQWQLSGIAVMVYGTVLAIDRFVPLGWGLVF